VTFIIIIIIIIINIVNMLLSGFTLKHNVKI